MDTPDDALVHTLLDEAAADAGDRVAVRDPAGTVTYARLAAQSRAVARWLADRGLRRGDRLVVQLPSRREQVAIVHGASRAGVALVPLNPAMKEFHLRSVVANAEPALAIAAGPQVAPLAAVCAGHGVDTLDLADVWPQIEAPTGHGDDGGTAAPVAGARPDDVAFLVYTSGSTSAPKAVVCPHRQVVFASRAIQQVLGYRRDDVVFCRFPLSWDYGLYKILLSCLGRSEIVLAGEESDLVLLRRMREVGATIVPIVPSLAAMITTLAARDPEPPPPVRMVTNTGAALPDATIAALRAAFPGVRVVRQFGQTECKRVSIVPPDEDRERPRSVGVPLPGTTVRILGADGAEVGVGEIGEIVVSGPHVMPGYWRAPEVTAAAFRDGSLHTGDYGSVDADGHLYFEGRRDDMFKRKGIRMSTLEIEAAATDVPGVRAAAVVPPADGRDLAIVVEADLLPHVVLKELAQRLEQAKVPAVCHVVDDLPLTLHGKNSRDALVALLADGKASS